MPLSGKTITNHSQWPWSGANRLKWGLVAKCTKGGQEVREQCQNFETGSQIAFEGGAL